MGLLVIMGMLLVLLETVMVHIGLHCSPYTLLPGSAHIFNLKKIQDEMYMNFNVFMKVKVTWHTAKYGDPYSEFVLCIYPPKVHTHSSEHTHTHTVNTHPEQSFMQLGSSWGFGALLKGTSVVVLGRREHCTVTPPTYNSCRPEIHNLSITSLLPLGHVFPTPSWKST